MNNADRVKNQITERFKNLVVDEKIRVEYEERLRAEATDNAEENLEINTSPLVWEKAFHDIFLEVLDIDTGYKNAKESYTNALMGAGSHENPQALYQFLDLITTRLEKIHIVKRLCNYLGLHNEMDRIIDSELNLLYNHPQSAQKTRTVELKNPIAGEFA